MNKARSFRFLRKASVRQGFAALMSVSFLFTVLISCMCGPFCGSAAADTAASGCCSGHVPVPPEPATDGCCSHEPGETHCVENIAEDALQLPDSSIPIAVPASVILEIILPKAADLPVRFKRAAAAAAVPIAPAYIQFQSFLA